MNKWNMFLAIARAVFYCSISIGFTLVIYSGFISLVNLPNIGLANIVFTFIIIAPINLSVAYMASKTLSQELEWPYASAGLIPSGMYYLLLPTDSAVNYIVISLAILLCLLGAKNRVLKSA